MKVGAVPENMLERVVLASGQAPTPFVDTLFTFVLARTVMAATKLGVFEALAAQPLTAAVVAQQCDTQLAASEKLLNTLVSIGYVRLRSNRYMLAPVARKWLLKSSPRSLYNTTLFRYRNWEWMEQLENFVQTGSTINFHSTLSSDEWGIYQRSMREIAGLAAPEVARRIPVPRGARDLLDIGGSHGYYSVVLCRRYPELRATVLDLPEAIVHAAPILAQENMGDRVIHRAGNALTEDLGEEAYDLVLISQVMHLFDENANRDLTQRVARALRPGGYLVVFETIRRDSPKQGGQTGALFDLFFALTTAAGTWSFDEMARWQRDAGLLPRKPIRFLTAPGIGAQAAMKPLSGTK